MNERDFHHGIYSIGIMSFFYCITWIVLSFYKLVHIL